MGFKRGSNRTLRCGVAAAALTVFAQALPAYAQAQTYSFDIPAQDLASALRAFARTSHQQVTFDSRAVRGKRSPALRGTYSARAALDLLIAGSGLTVENGRSGLFILRPAAAKAPPSPSVSKPSPTASPSSGEAKAGSAAANDESAAQQDIIVTGSNIRGAEYRASPVYKYTKEDIERSGATDLAGVLRNIPQNFSGGQFGGSPDGRSGEGEFRAFNDSGSISPNLRGLGNSSTLTLVNGRRLAPTAQSNVTDISMIPVAAIERVEILADGASAIYGADAVGGVVNILLRRDFDGVELSAYGLTNGEGDYSHLRANAAFGQHWSNGNILIAGSFGQYTPLRGGRHKATSLATTGDGLIEAYIYPDQTDYSAFGTLTQQLAPGVQVGVDGWWGHRDRRQITTGITTSAPNAYEDQGSKTDEFNVASSLDIELPRQWNLRIDGAFSKSLEETNRRTVRTVTRTDLNSTDARSSVLDIEAKVDGSLLTLPGGPVRVAFGGEWRQEKYDIEQVTLQLGVTNAAQRDIQRTIKSAFGEILVPLVAPSQSAGGFGGIDLSFAGRYTSYSDFGNTFNYKAGARVSLLKGFAIRGTYSTSFRPPDLDRQARRDVSGRTLSSVNGLFLNPNGAGTVDAIVVGGTAELRPETSKAITAGVDIAPPGSGLEVNLTWFKYDFSDRLGGVSTPVDLLRRSAYAPLITPVTSAGQVQSLIDEVISEGGSIFVDLPYTRYRFLIDGAYRNLSTQRVSGVDAVISYRHGIGSVSLSHTLSGTFTFQDKRQLTTTADVISVLGLYNQQPDLKARASTTLSRGNYSATLSASYVTGLINDRVAGFPPISDWLTVDFNLRVPIKLGRETSLGVSVLNLFDRDPPFVERVGRKAKYDSANANPLGRQFSVQLTTRF